mmetsp:Transcript_2753/g.4021  ORF Transcript_2753/g.4021 Transcript_2753/m.4021 type:complete len:265 (-) Transcript_2753:92-886(-)
MNNEHVDCRKDLVEGGEGHHWEKKLKVRNRRRFAREKFVSVKMSLIVTALLPSVLLLLLSLPSSSQAFVNPIDVITRDFQALTRKVTAHHILLPKSTDVALSLKQSIRNKVSPKSSDDPKYIVDVFSAAAQKYSRDEETAVRGGLLGTKVPQGYCRAKELDAACFKAPLGEIAGPIESEYGYHLLLVTERTNCPKLDGKYNKIIPDVDGVSTKFVRGDSQEGSEEIQTVALQQVGFWMGVSLAGGVLAEVAAKAANVVDTLPWE